MVIMKVAGVDFFCCRVTLRLRVKFRDSRRWPKFTDSVGAQFGRQGRAAGAESPRGLYKPLELKPRRQIGMMCIASIPSSLRVRA